MAEAKILKVKKKKWYPILAPKIFRQMQIGEMPLDDARKAIGRAVTANLMELTNDIKKQNINIKFVITKTDSDKLLTETIGYEVIPASIKRIVRRGRERIDSSIHCITADNKSIRIKTLLLARSTIRGSVKAALLRNLNDYLIKTIKKMPYEGLITELVSHKLQKTIYAQLSKIYPLKACEIRELNIEKEIATIEGSKEEEISPKEKAVEQDIEETEDNNQTKQEDLVKDAGKTQNKSDNDAETNN